MPSDASNLTRHLRRMLLAAREIPIESALLTAPVLEKNIKNTMGHTPPLLPLAESTQARGRDNTPLVDEGILRDSVEGHAEGPIAIAGSNDPVSRIHEFGSGRIPPRPAFQIGLAKTVPEALKIAQRVVKRRLRKR